MGDEGVRIAQQVRHQPGQLAAGDVGHRDLLEHGSPSLLNEAPVYLALHDALVDLGRHEEAKNAIARGLPCLVTRVHGLLGTAHAKDFLINLSPNAGLLAAAEGYGIVPVELSALLAG